MDVFGASTNVKIHEIIFEQFANPTKVTNLEIFERYMLALSQSQNPQNSILQKYFEILSKNHQYTNENIKQTLLLTVGTLSRKCDDIKLKSLVLKNFVNHLIECKNSNCRQQYLRALKNTENEIIVPILMKFIESQDIDGKSAVLGKYRIDTR